MNEPLPHIPTEVYLDFLGRSIEIHWNYHAILMFSIWMVLVPFCVIAIRFFKPRPAKYGLTRKVAIRHAEWWWFSVHKIGLVIAVGLSLAGLAVAMVASGGFSGSVHATFGMTTIVLGCLQVISALFRGTHGGKYYNNADPEDPATWHGDHFDYTLRRRLFESYHKTSGYLTGIFAVGAVASGLMQYPMPVLAVLAALTPLFFVVLWIIFEFQGRHYDGYKAVYGPDPEFPRTKASRDLY